jgi:hypothetical protein
MSKAFDMLAEDGFLDVTLAQRLKTTSVSATLQSTTTTPSVG